MILHEWKFKYVLKLNVYVLNLENGQWIDCKIKE